MGGHTTSYLKLVTVFLLSHTSPLAYLFKEKYADSLKNTGLVVNNFKILIFLSLQGSLTRDFQLQVISRISVPEAPEYPIRTISNFFENLRRFSRIKKKSKRPQENTHEPGGH